MTREDILVQVLLEEPDGTSSIAVADEVDRAARIPPWHEPCVRSPKPCVAKLLGVILAIVDAAALERVEYLAGAVVARRHGPDRRRQRLNAAAAQISAITNP